MPYCTQDDILKLLPAADLAQLTAESGDTPDADVVAEAITAADALINSYIGRRYQLPLAAAPGQVKALSVTIGIYKLYRRRGFENAARRQDYEDAVKFLDSVSKGTAIIEGASGVEPAGQVQDVTEISSQTRVFDRDSLRGM